MMQKPEVRTGDWITFGTGLILQEAVVSKVYQDSSDADIEVVYLDNQARAINADMIWKVGAWHFKYSGPCGGYADNYDRLSQWVSKLRSGRYQ